MIDYVSKGVDSLSNEAIASINDFLSSQIASDGGFKGRDGKSDLYYTVFGIQIALAMKSKKCFSQVIEFIRNFDTSECLDFVHTASLVRCSAMLDIKNKTSCDLLLSNIELYRSDDGGYNHLQKNAGFGTTYAAFLAHLAYQESGAVLPDQQRLLKSIKALKMKDGSFANDSAMDSGSTTATAAAIMLLNACKENVEQSTIDSLLSRGAAEGGFRASSSSPIPDLLSTATALYALRSVKFDFSDIKHIQKEFISSLWNEDGGFSGHIFDDVSDCEYTFYALLALGIF